MILSINGPDSSINITVSGAARIKIGHSRSTSIQGGIMETPARIRDQITINLIKQWIYAHQFPPTGSRIKDTNSQL